MTGTAATESTEFESIYKLKVTIVPTNKPMVRKVNKELFVAFFVYIIYIVTDTLQLSSYHHTIF